MKRILFPLLLLLAWPNQALSNEWKLDTVHSNFYFDVQHIYATVRGQFTDFTGEVSFDPDNPEKSHFDFAIKVDSIDTKIGKRDTHLRSPDFFDADKYPLITFKSGKVTRAANNRYVVEGALTIKGITKNVALEFLYHGQKENPLKAGQIVAGLDSRLLLDRLEYHIGDGKFYKMGAVGKDIAVLITLELLRDK
ncbi:MAG: YceI family protein [Desulfobulbaceae bacterium]|nr:YceI family protein [Desulfobulbaceae bacterium]